MTSRFEEDHWRDLPLKFAVHDAQTGVWGDEPNGGDDDILCARVADFDRSTAEVVDVPTIRKVSEKDRAKCALKHGDLLVEKSGGTERNPVGTAVAYRGPVPAVYANFILRLRMTEEHDPRFWLYALHSSHLIGRTWNYVRQTTGIQNLDVPGFLSMTHATPKRSTQKRIADYLDRETAEIDVMLAKMDELTEKLEARWTAVIDHELSSHLRAPLESGWAVTDCMHKTATFVDEGENFIVSIGQLDGAHIDTTTSPRTTEEQFAYLRSGGRTPKSGDAVMSRNASVGKLALVTPETPAFALGQDVVLLSPFKNEDARLLAYAMGTTRTREALDLMMQGTTFKRINVASIRKLPWVRLSGDEQIRIADRLDEVTGKIDQMLAKTAELKSLLIERRSALITDVVTGKKQVHS